MTIDKQDDKYHTSSKSWWLSSSKGHNLQSCYLRVFHLQLMTVRNVLEPFLIADLNLNVILLLIVTIIFRLRLITIVILGFSGELCLSNFLDRQRKIQVKNITDIIMSCVTNYLSDVLWNGSMLQLNLENILFQGLITLQDIEFQKMHTGLLGICTTNSRDEVKNTLLWQYYCNVPVLFILRKAGV